MLVSIVIPAYNEEKYLPKTLESVFAQTHTDKTSEVAKKYDVRVLRTIKKTPAFARQKGVEVAQGEIIVCLDADTFLPKDHLLTVVSEFKKDAKVVGLTGIIGGWGGNPWERFGYKWANAIFIPLSFLFGKPGFQGQSFAFRKTAFLRIGGFKTDIYSGEDMDLGFRMSKIGKIKFLPRVMGISSVRRIKEGPILKTISRGFFSYLRLLWGLPVAKKEKEPFPAIR
ncbi:MAG: glycosyl transferase/polysaccharide deacetylase [Microgenomates group bacterium LiPW_16]|nr:MAG: glycosyl transferase/polysaccharide deacetylase [Microgenomates group bacterium LiPW_16]